MIGYGFLTAKAITRPLECILLFASIPGYYGFMHCLYSDSGLAKYTSNIYGNG
jgi:hypothetical protein